MVLKGGFLSLRGRMLTSGHIFDCHSRGVMVLLESRRQSPGMLRCPTTHGTASQPGGMIQTERSAVSQLRSPDSGCYLLNRVSPKFICRNTDPQYDRI